MFPKALPDNPPAMLTFMSPPRIRTAAGQSGRSRSWQPACPVNEKEADIFVDPAKDVSNGHRHRRSFDGCLGGDVLQTSRGQAAGNFDAPILTRKTASATRSDAPISIAVIFPARATPTSRMATSELDSFDISHDLKYRIPFIKASDGDKPETSFHVVYQSLESARLDEGQQRHAGRRAN